MTPMTCLIPSRMESTRFPGKALATIKQWPMVIHCAKNSIEAGLETWVCTDNNLIQDACDQEKINVVMTPHFDTGTDRCSWAAKELRSKKLIVLQGDEPLINSRMLEEFMRVVESINNENCLVNGLNPISPHGDHDPNTVKAYCDKDNHIYGLTRRPRSEQPASFVSFQSGPYRQLGLYGGLLSAFEAFKSLTRSPLETAENIEMLRWISHGKQLLAAQLNGALLSVDTPADLKNVQNQFSND